MIHNYAHKLPGAAQENEFAYHLDNDNNFWNVLFSSDFLIHFFSYWGHLGVPIFVFLSGYGLALKYNDHVQIKWKNYLGFHYRKLFFPLLYGTLAYIAVILIRDGNIHFSIARFIFQCTMLLNLIYPYEQNITPGPYWYFGMTMQLYLLYLFIIHRRSLKYMIGITMISIVFMGLLIYDTHRILIWTKYNVVGWMTPLALGVLAARFPSYIRYFSVRAKASVVFICLLPCLILCGRNYYLWLMTPVVVLLMGIAFVKFIPSFVWEKVKVIGDISLYILIVHPIVREVTLPISQYWGSWSIIIYASLTLAISLLVAKLVTLFKNKESKIWK
jgi:hypothetical protein